jgi:hypothetical protein
MGDSTGWIVTNSSAVDAKTLEPLIHWPPIWITWRNEGLVLPDKWNSVIKNARLNLNVEMTASVRGGRLVCERLCLSSERGNTVITTATLRKIPVAALMKQAAKSVAQVHEAPHDNWEDEGTAAENRANIRIARLVAGGRTRGDRGAILKKVASTYRKAVKLDHPAPREFVATELNYSVSYVGKLLVEARRQGLLRKALPGRPGEQPLLRKG